VNIELIDSPDRFAALQTEWNELLGASEAESPFLTWEWLNAWWTHLGESRRLAIVTVRDEERLTAIAPLCASRGRLPFLWRYEFMGTGFAGSDYLDAIVRRGCAQDALPAIGEFMQRKNAALHLVRLPQNAALSRLAAPLGESGWSVRATTDGFCPFIRIAGHSWDSFLSTIGPAHRATTRRRLRSLERIFTMCFEQITDDAMRQYALAKLFDFHRTRFGTRGTAFHTPAMRAFHLDATDRLQKAGVLRLFVLRLNDDVVGVMYGMSFKNRFYFYQHGYDPKLQSHGIGRAVLDMSIRAAIDEGLDEFDLLYGGEAYKSAWTSDKRTLTRLELFPAHLGGRVHRGAVDTERTLRALARRVISVHAP
jgi:CelD/BcsL family acetyltransferase involved in cellulose biosynthesis